MLDVEAVKAAAERVHAAVRAHRKALAELQDAQVLTAEADQRAIDAGSELDKAQGELLSLARDMDPQDLSPSLWMTRWR